MQSKAKTVAEYLASLPPERRAVVAAVRKAILANLDPGFQETMQYGMIGYSVPHSTYPAGYHCKPSEPVPYAALAAQKNAYSVYLMGLYLCADGTRVSPHAEWFRKAWVATGRKLDMGAACVRFKRLEDCALDVLGEAIRRVPLKTYLALYEGSLKSAARGKQAKAKPAKSRPAKPKPAKSRPAAAKATRKPAARRAPAKRRAAR